MKQDPVRRGVALVAVSLVLAGVTVYVALQKPSNILAAAVLQAITLVFSTYGAYVFATASVQSAAQELIRPHARSAFRRVRRIYEALVRIVQLIEQQLAEFDVARQPGNLSAVDYQYARLTLVMLGQIVTEQANTVDDALEDWRDLVPDEVQAIEDRVRKMRGEQNAG